MVVRLTARSSPDAQSLANQRSHPLCFPAAERAVPGSLAVGEWQQEELSHSWPLQLSAYRAVVSAAVMPASFAIAEKMPCLMSSSSGLSNSTICPACSTITLAEGNKTSAPRI